MKNKVILLGRINFGKKPIGGETTKNQFLMAELSKYCDVIPLDFYRNKQRPWIFFQTAWTLLRRPYTTLILSTSASNVYGLMKLLTQFNKKRKIIHWVVGGEFANLVRDGRYDVKVLNMLTWNLAQSQGMVDTLRACGVENAEYVRNFKRIAYYPEPMAKEERSNPNVYKFVYLSRIMKSKGVDLLLNVVERLNADGYKDRFTLDMYGKMDDVYKNEFEGTISRIENAEYHGLLNLRSNEGYDTLAKHQVMVFPTHHKSEGIAGVFIDAFIASVPVLTTRWNYNAEIVEDGKTGILIPANDEDALYESMKEIIEGKVDLVQLSSNARAEAEQYDADRVMTSDYLKKIGII